MHILIDIPKLLVELVVAYHIKEALHFCLVIRARGVLADEIDCSNQFAVFRTLDLNEFLDELTSYQW